MNSSWLFTFRQRWGSFSTCQKWVWCCHLVKSKKCVNSYQRVPRWRSTWCSVNGLHNPLMLSGSPKFPNIFGICLENIFTSFNLSDALLQYFEKFISLCLIPHMNHVTWYGQWFSSQSTAGSQFESLVALPSNTIYKQIHRKLIYQYETIWKSEWNKILVEFSEKKVFGELYQIVLCVVCTG